MKDNRIKELVRQVIEYSVSLKKGERLLIEAWDGAEDFVLEFVEAAQRAGAYPYVSLNNASVQRQFIAGATEESMQIWYQYQLARMEKMDAYVAVRKQDNINEYVDILPEKMALYHKYHSKLHCGQRMEHTKWCILSYPNAGMAQLAGMSTEAFEDYYFKACCINYKRLNEIAAALNRLAAKTDKVHILAPDTDLHFRMAGRCQLESLCGIFNIPCGETGMSVVTDSVNGTIRYNVPSLYQGFVFQDVRLRFQDGRIVEATSNNTELMNQILDTDVNARYIGEFALGFNPMITRAITNTLFDEKMAMSLHFTPGNGPYNPSAIHWDLVQSHAPEMGGGEIWFDDVLIRKDGLFVIEDLLPLNPENLLKEIASEGN